ncbi:D-lactate dehydrogenase [cytochrome], mitochondrial precursor, putative [Candida dubliniensis CD36]|uniref:D-lactate dehydrogenase (cytochrome) n=1 Tax=Candida dubliniensis (strain CD36 / ATCC MYA-646 / CBS 7987 / NCPF 3949 / NRRL Y-17841) TaxID=573826 RepID=B9W6L4_CANDC|nr:D-lactate dehydrogenase [cytochrome], mitochondrial precursor, putative [Candida dubliniensis CD36]CAX44319.1 D-lactate dehydrogenase [cytochrome], mitochondrial precursor, putative [Candida dubliniensis CD36]
MFTKFRPPVRQLTGVFRSYSVKSKVWLPPKTSRYLIIGVVFLGGGIAIGTHNGRSTNGKDFSTTPLSTLDSPVYATEHEFQTGLAKIANLVGADNISRDKRTLQSHNDSFFSTHHPPNPEVQAPGAIIYPNSTNEVSEILKIANKFRIPIVANSGLTSIEGQNIHTRGPYSISISFQRMNNILAFHPKDLDVVVQPGVCWQDLNEFLSSNPEGKHLMFGPDPGPGANIGGMVGTSASGTNAFKYGTMKENVVNLTVVLADGTVIKTRQRPRKSSAGYDLTRLFIGSEGTLGLVTEATVKLHVRPKYELVSVACFSTIKEVAEMASDVIAQGVSPNAMEILDETMIKFVNESTSKKQLESPTLFFKLGGSTKDSILEQSKMIQNIGWKHKMLDFKTSSSEEENDELWSARRNGFWSTFEYGKKILHDANDVQGWGTDIAVPISQLAKVISQTNDDLISSGFNKKFSIMGHIGDGNCHFLILYNSPDYYKVKVLVDRMVNRAIEASGTCSGEHGIGVGKRRYLATELGETAVDLARTIKLSLDPNRILNPDKIFMIDPQDDLDNQLDEGSLLNNTSSGCNHQH